MHFKRLQRDELDRLTMMIEGGDREMCHLAAKILNNKQKIRYSFVSILIFHLALTILTIATFIFAAYHHANWYLIPVLLGFIFQVLFSFIWLGLTAKQRRPHDQLAEYLEG